MVSQKNAVTNAVISVVNDYELGGEVVLSEVITGEQKKTVRSMLFQGFRSGQITFGGESSKLNDDSYLTKYVAGLLDNWIRKNPEFNFGGRYAIKNPGSRSGSKDDTLKALRALAKTVTDQTVLAEINDAIKDRMAEIKPTATVEINVEALPEHLRHLVS
jgi:hypothetical protein